MKPSGVQLGETGLSVGHADEASSKAVQAWSDANITPYVESAGSKLASSNAMTAASPARGRRRDVRQGSFRPVADLGRALGPGAPSSADSASATEMTTPAATPSQARSNGPDEIAIARPASRGDLTVSKERKARVEKHSQFALDASTLG